MGKLECKIEKKGDSTVFYLSGKIDEDFRRKDLELNDLEGDLFNGYKE